MSVGDGEGTAGQQCIYILRNILTFLVSHIGLVSLVVGYCIIGAFTFEALEAEHELEVKKKMSTFRHEVTEDLWDITGSMPVLFQDNWTVSVSHRLKKFELTLIEAMKKKGWDGSEDLEDLQWTFGGSLFYSIILITTIGYGHIAPKTQWGKIVTIFYAVLGIPLMLLCLANIGDAMAHSFRFLYWKVCCYACTRKPKRTRTRRGRSIRGSGRYRHRSRPGSIHRGQRHSQRSADSGRSDSAFSRSSNSASISDQDRRYLDDPNMEIEIASPQIHRGRSSQHSKKSSKQPVGNSTEVSTTDQGSSRNNHGGDMSHHGPRSPVILDETRLTGYFNKYALDKNGLSSREDMIEHIKIQPTTIDNKTTTELPYKVPKPGIHRSSRNDSDKSDRLARLPEDDYYFEDDYYDDYSYDDSETHVAKPVPIWLSILLVVGYIFGGATLFSGWEQWNFLDSAYFCFVTLTTIGFGDFVPAQKVKENVEVSIALCSLYLLFGIALLAMSFNLVQEEVINSVKSVAKRLGIIKDDDEEDDD
ncbi:uncharacterized protein LOC136028185 [Artemia franciscana]|uniref:Potassium channel domain-containing protein n=1 Tax=Artemia franciscana TaxID=6661 RepID=A0AA88HBE7_ARTSF|nr:hypothetical protein QYM36_014516 [Artemia franciscana]